MNFLKKNNNNIILSLFILILFLIGGNIIWADSNGIWTYSTDIRGGIFGSDEQVSNMNFTFINPVYFGVKLFSLSNPSSYFIDISGRTQLNNLILNSLSTNYGFIENLILGIPSCSGKLYTNSSGNVLCGIDNINDADSNPTNELQNLNSVLTLGNDAGNKRIINVLDPINPQDVVIKDYVDKKILDLENQIKALDNSPSYYFCNASAGSEKLDDECYGITEGFITSDGVIYTKGWDQYKSFYPYKLCYLEQSKVQDPINNKIIGYSGKYSSGSLTHKQNCIKSLSTVTCYAGWYSDDGLTDHFQYGTDDNLDIDVYYSCQNNGSDVWYSN